MTGILDHSHVTCPSHCPHCHSDKILTPPTPTGKKKKSSSKDGGKDSSKKEKLEKEDDKEAKKEELKKQLEEAKKQLQKYQDYCADEGEPMPFAEVKSEWLDNFSLKSKNYSAVLLFLHEKAIDKRSEFARTASFEFMLDLVFDWDKGFAKKGRKYVASVQRRGGGCC